MNANAAEMNDSSWSLVERKENWSSLNDDYFSHKSTNNPMNSSTDLALFMVNSTSPVITITLSSMSMVIACFLLMVVTIGGNTLVIVAFNTEPALQVITNHWIVSLALTDIILAAVVMPLQISRELFDGKWIFGTVACDLFISLDVLCCTCSIYHLCLISLDRYFCIRYPISYNRRRTPQATLAAICTTWLCCVSISLPRLLGWKDKRDDVYACYMTNMSYMLFSSAVSFYIPLLLIFIMYYGIYRVTKKQARKFPCFTSSYRLSSGHCLVPEVNGDGGIVSTALIATTLDAALSVARHSNESKSTDPDAGSSSGAGVGGPGGGGGDGDGVAGGGDGNGGGGAVKSVFFRDIVCPKPAAPIPPQRPFKFIDYLRHRIDGIRQFLSRNRGTEDTKGEHDQKSRVSQTLLSESIATALPMDTSNSTAISRAILAVHTHLTDSHGSRERIRRARLNRRRQKQETRAAKVVVIVLAAFVLLWTPFFIVNVISPLCGDQCRIGDEVWKLVTWLGYCNSSVNPFIYTCFNRTFRRAFANVFRLCCRARRSPRYN